MVGAVVERRDDESRFDLKMRRASQIFGRTGTHSSPDSVRFWFLSRDYFLQIIYLDNASLIWNLNTNEINAHSDISSIVRLTVLGACMGSSSPEYLMMQSPQE